MKADLVAALVNALEERTSTPPVENVTHIISWIAPPRDEVEGAGDPSRFADVHNAVESVVRIGGLPRFNRQPKLDIRGGKIEPSVLDITRQRSRQKKSQVIDVMRELLAKHSATPT